VQLKTATKAFCGCSTRFGDPPNSNTCPVCLGLPGALPVLNKRAVELGIRAALALHLNVQEFSRFARKNYFYPDLPKGYQISMYELPLATGGWLEIEHDGQTKRIGITRLHLEDDAAKNLHEGFPDSAEKSYVDYNRGGTPLAEIVSEPDLRSPTEAHAYLRAQAGDAVHRSERLQHGGRLAALRRQRQRAAARRRKIRHQGRSEKSEFLPLPAARARIRNRAANRRARIRRQNHAQETRLWNVAAGRTEPMRSKEFAHDYRYFPEPDLLPVRVSAAWRDEIAAAMPELPEAKRKRFVRDYGITPYDAGVLASTRALADYFEAVAPRARRRNPPPTGFRSSCCAS
jgi:aspartyl-tRNA(Asn)/glutamyl-tRNA(Gln) amidotransferase subunit B